MELSEIITNIISNVVSVLTTVFSALDIRIGGISLTLPIFIALSILFYIVSTLIGGDDE